MAHSDQILALKRKRTSIKAACTRIKTYADSVTQLTPETVANLEERKDKLASYWKEYDWQSEIEAICDGEGGDREAFEEMFFGLTAALRCKIAGYNRVPSNSRSAVSTPVSVGEAAIIIQSLELTDSNYQVAWDLLKQRYDNKRAIVHTHLRALFELPNIAKENAVELLSSKFDPITAREWQVSLTGTELPAFKQLSEFLEHRCNLLESLNRGQTQPAGKRLAAHVATASLLCGYCQGKHLIYYCREFIKLPVARRIAEIRKRKLCANCLRGGNHYAAKCKMGACKTCGAKHNSMLHLQADSGDITEKGKAEGVLRVERACIAFNGNCVYNDATGTRQSCRVLLDSGSQANFITQDCVERLNLRPSTGSVRITGINGMTSDANEIVKVKLHSRLSGFCASLDVPDRIPRYKKRFSDGLSPAVEVTARDARGREVRAFHISVADAALQNQLAKFWQIEEDFRPSDSYTSAERFCERHFLDNTKRNKEGRIIVTLPIIKQKLENLGETRDIAMRRFCGLERRLNRDPGLKSQYAAFMREYLALGHMKLVREENDKDKGLPTYYLPHHCILKTSNETTKIRVVFDASCKSSTGVSLNDALMIGPTVQQDLFSIVSRFRIFRFVFSADIAKMYRQILVDPQQTRLQRVLWRDEATASVQTYELITLTYGTATASYLATRALQFLAEMYAEEFPAGSRRVKRDFYVDDLLTGADTIEEALALKNQIVKILNRGGFQLSKWHSNESVLINDMYDKHNAEVQIDRDATSRILGILWNPSMDVFRFAIELPTDSHKITKRVILSEISRLFDPLGLIGPVIIIPKMLLQEIWQLKIQWDESIPLDMHARWSAFKRQLRELNDLSVPRFIGRNQEGARVQIHGFCDASQRAYGACLYIRRQIHGNEVQIDLLCSKTRIAPLRAISIPRLELCAALLLAQLLDKVRSSIDIKDVRYTLWSDSTIALRWISSCSRKWSVFVSNRVGEIQRLTSGLDWRHVPTTENPADLLSRGVHPHDIGNAALWWRGPALLKSSEESWPSVGEYVPESEMPERRRIVAAVAGVVALSPFSELIARCSSLDKLCRIVAYCRRFIGPRLRSEGDVGVHVSHVEISAALENICKLVQGEVFSNEFEQLKKGNALTSASSLKSLSPFLDKQGLIRVGGRLEKSQLRCRPAISEAKMGVLPAPRVTPSRPFSNCGIDYAGPLIIREGKRRNARNSKAYRVAGDSHLTFEELQTTLCEIEAVLNSRPLTPLSSDPNDLAYLTPGHFLVGEVLSDFPCHDLTDLIIKEGRLIRLQRVEQLRQHFWSRWSREYLNQLQQR
ncbi:uncharacterized protein LOC114939979 [Nylanderia fulva]|uniref:uncharacterized protein LOC114939979 n=1 Tax=Nylanderia fulva TaxID=613905 RepID=UPI0010FB23CC|nr:uncharacterized protein LOC114939979 [Nylanderia fulva]